MNTKEMLDAALKLAGLTECPADSGEIVPGENVKRVLMGLDVDNPELMVGKLMEYDAVVCHHTRMDDLKGCSKLREELPKEFLMANGAGVVEAGKAVMGRAAKMDDQKHAMDHNRVSMGARTLGLPLVSIMSPAERIAQKIVQDDMDKRFGADEFTPLSAILDALNEYPETKAWSLEPAILIGNPNSHAGKIVVAFTGLSEAMFMDGYNPDGDDTEIFKTLARHGAGTLIVKYLGGAEKTALEEQKILNVVCIGHMVGDSIGMNAIAAEWEKAGVKVDKFSGIVG